jgi:hypothetical protein
MAYIGTDNDGLTEPDAVLQCLGADRAAAAAAYSQFVLSRPDLNTLVSDARNGRLTVRDALDRIAILLDVPPWTVEFPSRRGSNLGLVLAAARRLTGWTHRQFAEELGMSTSGVATAAARGRRLLPQWGSAGTSGLLA